MKQSIGPIIISFGPGIIITRSKMKVTVRQKPQQNDCISRKRKPNLL